MIINDEILVLKKEKTELKKKWSTKFLSDLDLILEKCFLKSKTKKEQFITQEKLEVELIKLLQSQKKFTADKKFDTSILAVFDYEDNMVGKVKNIDFENKEVQFLNICGAIKVKNLNLICLFDIYSLESQVFYEKQKKFHDTFTYKDTFAFLTHEKTKIDIKEIVRFGVLCNGGERTKLTVPIDYDK